MIIDYIPVVYHDDLTDAFLRSLKKIMEMGIQKTAIIALEKRYSELTLLKLEVFELNF